MSLWFGRVDLGDSETFHVDNGRTSTFSGDVIGSTLAEATAKRAQLLDTVANGAVEPLVWSEDPSVDGFYRPVKASVSNVEAGLSVFTFDYELEVLRIAHAQSALTRYRVEGQEREGAPGATSEDFWLAIPTARKGFDLNGDDAIPYNRTGPGLPFATAGAAANASDSCFMYVDNSMVAQTGEGLIEPANFYRMSPYFLMDGYQRCGDWLPALANMTDWELGNGYLRIRPASSSTHSFRLTCPVPAANAWGTVTYEIAVGTIYDSTYEVLTFSTARLLELSAEVVHVRFTGFTSSGAGDNYKVEFDMRLRRGSLFVECTSSGNAATKHSIADVAAPAYTVFLVGKAVRRSAHDGDNNRLFIIGDKTLDTSLAGAGMVRANADTTSIGWAIGCELNGSSSVAPNTHAEQADHFWADMTVTIEVS